LVGWLAGWLAGWLGGWLAGWLAGWLFNGTSIQKGQVVPTAGRKLAQSTKDGQRDTMHITLRYTMTM